MKINEYNIITRDECLDAYKLYVEKDTLDILHYYGVGGIGKTTFKNNLMNYLSAENNLVLDIDFGFSGNHNITVVLEKLRDQILRYKRSASFPRFEYAMKIYYEKSAPQYVMKDRNILPLVDESEILASGFNVVSKSDIPLISTIPKIVQTGYRHIKSLGNWAKIKGIEDLKYIDQLEVEEIEGLVLGFWHSDFLELKQNKSMNITILMDTFEKVGNLSGGEFKLADPFKWLGTMIEEFDFCDFITFGREKIEGMFHNKRVKPVLIEPFNYEDTKTILEKYYIRNEEFVEVFYSATEGIPYYLYLAVKTYNNIKKARIPTIKDFEGDRKLVVERFIRYLDDKEKDMLEILSIPNFWNESLYNYLFDYDASIYRINRAFLEETSLINFNKTEGYWTMHELLRTHLVESLKEEKSYFYRINDKVYEYYNKEMKNVHDINTQYENMLSQYFYHAKSCESPIEFAMDTIDYVQITHVKSLITLAENIALYIEEIDVPLKEIISYRLYFNITFSYLERMELDQANYSIEKTDELFKSLDKDIKALYILSHINLKAFNALTNKRFKEARDLYLNLITFIEENQLEREYKNIMKGIYDHLSVIYTQLDDKDKSNYYSKMALLKNDINNPEIVTLINASSTDLLNNEYCKALNRLDVVFELFENKSEYNERDYLVALSNKAEALRGLKEYKASFKLHTEVLDRRVFLLGSTHFDVAESYAALGFLLQAQGERKESNKYLEEALTIFGDISSRNVLTIYSSLVENYYEMEQPLRYIDALKEKLKCEQSIFGQNSMKTLGTLFQIIEADENQFLLIEKLIEVFKEHDLISDEKYFIRLLNCMNKIVKVGKYKEALSLLMKINDELIVYHTIKQAEVLLLIARSHELDGNLTMAVLNLKSALDIYESIRPSDQSVIGVTHCQLGHVYWKLEDLKQAKNHFKFALPILDKIPEAEKTSNIIRQRLM